MDANKLLELVQAYKGNKDFITNEETAKMALVVPFIRFLGYDPNNPREVRLEYAAEFTQGDGKKYADRMDFAIFDKSGAKPLMVIETKPLGTDLRAKAQQLARYIAQMADLHFGIITDGCNYLFYGDLDQPNQMDRVSFFTFSLEDSKADWGKIATFLTKFSRDSFNAETLVTDAENSRYRQAMIEKLASVLRNPASDENFLKWLSEGIYKSKRTSSAMARLSEVAREAIEPALIRVMEDDFLEKLKERFQRIREEGEQKQKSDPIEDKGESQKVDEVSADSSVEDKTKAGIETTNEEMEFYRIVRDICSKNGENPEEILYRDTVNYFNVSYHRPTKWFVRYFVTSQRPNIVTLVPLEEAKLLSPGFEVEEAPPTFGVSRIYIENPEQTWALNSLIIKSLELMKIGKKTSSDSEVEESGSCNASH